MFTIFYDSLTEALWFQGLSPQLKGAQMKLIAERERNPKGVEELIQYDKPDIILLHNEIPVLVLEKTTEVPTGHNVGQRFARLVRAVEHGVLTLYFFPYDARKHGEYTGICNLNIRLIEACLNIEKIHQTPLLTIDWITDRDGELVTDGSESIEIANIVDKFIASGFNQKCSEVQKQLSEMSEDYKRRLSARPSYGKMPPSVQRYKTIEFCKEFSIDNVDSDFEKRPFTYVYMMDMTPSKCKRQDPYTGTQFIYDYMVCRIGKLPKEKKNNLVLYFPQLSKKVWFENNPNNLRTKSCNWYLVANCMIFSDGHYFNNLR